MGKTISFLLTILFRPKSVIVIVTSLNVLGMQLEAQLQAAGIFAISVLVENSTEANYRVRSHSCEETQRLTCISGHRKRPLENGHHQVVVINSEQAMKIGDGFKKLLKKEAFTSQIVSVAFNEAHCINQWESFHSEYWEISRLRYQLTNVPFILASATFTPTILSNIKSIFGIFSDAHGEIWGLCTTDLFEKVRTFAGHYLARLPTKKPAGCRSARYSACHPVVSRELQHVLTLAVSRPHGA